MPNTFAFSFSYTCMLSRTEQSSLVQVLVNASGKNNNTTGVSSCDDSDTSSFFVLNNINNGALSPGNRLILIFVNPLCPAKVRPRPVCGNFYFYTLFKNIINTENMSSLVGKKAPLFKAGAVIKGGEMVEDFSLEQFLGKKYVVFFFYPKDFTFVCPTELHAFQDKLKEFESRNCAVVACSTDTEESHWGWLQMEKKAGGIKGVTYPIVADTTKTIS